MALSTDASAGAQGPIPAQVGEGRRCRVRRAWPAGDEVVLELIDPSGCIFPGRWHPVHGIDVGVTGEDAALPGLARRARSGGRVIGHRLGRRAVVRTEQHYTKLTRPGRIPGVVARHRAVADAATPISGFTLPAIDDVDTDDGAIVFAAAKGQPILDGHDPVGAARRTGAALGRFAHCRPVDLPDHSVEDEVAVLERWRDAAMRLGTLPDASTARFDELVAETVGRLRRLGDRPRVLAHRDLHDGQILEDHDGTLVLLDLDTAGRADPALDIGNLLAHIDLAACAGRITARDATAVATAFLEGCGPMPTDREAIATHRQAATLRLVAVHSFRPDTRSPALTLLGDRQPGSTNR